MDKREKKPNGYWTYENSKIEALKYNTKKELSEKNNTVYKLIRRNKWNELFSHMIKTKKSVIWTYEKCKESALKCKSRKDLNNEYNRAYTLINKNKWFELIEHFEDYKTITENLNYEKCKEIASKCKNRIEIRKKYLTCYMYIYKKKWFELIEHFESDHYWTYDKCKEISLKYKNKTEFRKSNKNVYKSIQRNKWFELYSHMETIHKSRGYWTKENCQKESLKYNTRSEFKSKSGGAFNAAKRNNWLDDICSNMEQLGSKHKRMIYAYEFNDNHVYIGLTFNINQRNNNHKTDIYSQVYKHIQKTQLEPTLIKISDYIDVNEASSLEMKTEEKYKNSGWIILNKAKTGGIGATKMLWNKELCMQEAKKYTTISDFIKYSNKAYGACLKYGWSDDCCKHMTRKCAKNKYWNNKTLCLEEAKKYNKISHFKKKSSSAYKYAKLNNWLDECCEHMQKKEIQKGHWNIKENCLIEAKKYKTRTELQKNCSTCYKKSLLFGWISEFYPTK